MAEEATLTCSSVQSFEKLVHETISDVLRQILGEKPAKIVVQCFMEEKFSLTCKSDIKKVEDILRKIFGASSVTIEIFVLKRLYSKFNLKFREKECYQFSDYLLELKSHLKVRDREMRSKMMPHVGGRQF
ncbi:MAG: hypothetical protein QW270_03295 [Candidatus Bathyarchaeia archaeon]